MTELVTAAQMRAVEQAAIAAGATTGRLLMERAGEGVVAAVLAEWPDLATGPHRATVLCGPGNNGGDGFVVARLLRERGWDLRVLMQGDPARLPPDARANHDRWCALGAVEPLDPGTVTLHCDLLVDALFGTGLGRPLDMPALLAAIEDGVMGAIDNDIGHIVSVDMPSGFCADSGRWLGPADEYPQMISDLVVTFHRPKVGHVLPLDPWKRRVADIGLRPPGNSGINLVSGPWQRLTKQPLGLAGEGAGHKFSHGHALVLAGGPGRGGAARLAARAALRIGAGLVTVGCLPEALAENSARLDAVMLRAVADGEALSALLEDARITALCIGPGLGLDRREAGLVAAVLGARRRTVLDADALTLIARDPALFGALHADCILTPHDGEFARLFPAIAGRLAGPALAGPAISRLDAARAAAAQAGCTVLLKGPVTVIADPAGQALIHAATGDRAAPWLATAGSGDVLGGLIAGLLARGNNLLSAAGTAAFLHAEAARTFGPGLIAEDLPETIPRVLRDLGVT